MKTFDPFIFDLKLCRQEVAELREWLAAHPILVEKRQILPFFRARRHLSAFVASYGSELTCYDRIAFEYPLFGDFTCDLVVGDSAPNAYCLIEFEDAGPTSLFIQRGKRATRDWSPRFEHGYSQIIDWFYKLDDMRRSNDLIARFGSPYVTYSGFLIIGRDQYLKAGERERLAWRRANVVVGSQRIACVTFDGLVEKLESRLATFRDAEKLRG
ncbi:MAG: Shedu immune nuclease family protein [Isosphaeraceae bacterium]